MTFGNFIFMVVNGLMGSIMIVGAVVVIISVFTMDLGTMFFGIVLVMGSFLILSISIKIKESFDDKNLTTSHEKNT